MKKLLVVILPILLCGFTCTTSLPGTARDTAGALQGAITAAQAQYQTTCTANPSQQACTIINQAVSAQNALITATEAYCGWTAPVDPNATSANGNCVPVKGAQAGLQTALANATLFITELKGVIK